MNQNDGGPSVRRIAVAGVVGTLIESYDFALFGLGAALVFADQFFPDGDPAARLLAALAAFAVGFAARPFGGIALAHLGDRAGRTPMMVVTLLLMGFATLGIGLLPTYDSVGLLAPALLVLLRLAQGFGAGAEYVGATLVLMESGGARGRGMRACLPGVGYFAGVLLATLAFTAASAMPQERFDAWGWRLPFLGSVVALLVGLYFRLAIGETPAFARARAAGNTVRFPIADAVRRRPRALLVALAGNGPSIGLTYFSQVFMLSYVTDRVGLSSTAGLVATVTAAACAIVTVPLFGALADRAGRRPVSMGGSAFFIVFAFPLFWLVGTGNVALVVIALSLLLAVGAVALGAAQAALFPELFETRHRYSGVVVTRETSGALLGGTMPVIAAALSDQAGGATWPVALLVMVYGAGSLAAVRLAPETRNVDLTKSLVPARS